MVQRTILRKEMRTKLTQLFTSKESLLLCLLWGFPGSSGFCRSKA